MTDAMEQILAIKKIVEKEYADKNEDEVFLELVYHVGLLAGSNLCEDAHYLTARIAALSMFWREKLDR